MKNNFAVCFFLVLLSVAVGSPSILFIGNSYTYVNDLPVVFGKLAAGQGKSFNISSFTIGGESLCGHANNTKVSELLSQHWDVVILQDQSQSPSLVDSRRNTIKCINTFFKPKLQHMASVAPTRVILYSTWGRRNGDAEHKDLFPSFVEMQIELVAGYEAYANALVDEQSRYTVRIAPVGLSFYQIYKTSLPDPLASSSLFSRLYMDDNSHPTIYGTYVAACCMYMRIFDETPVGISFAPPGIAPEEAKMLQGLVSLLQ